MASCGTEEHERIKEKIIKSERFAEKVERAGEIFSLIGDSSRIKILIALMFGELCVYHICEIVGAKQSATSQHLRRLKDNRIVKSRREGNQILYSLADEHVSEIIKLTLEHLDCNI